MPVESSHPLQHHPPPGPGNLASGAQASLPTAGGTGGTAYHHYQNNCQASSMQTQYRKLSHVPPTTNFYPSSNINNNNSPYFYCGSQPSYGNCENSLQSSSTSAPLPLTLSSPLSSTAGSSTIQTSTPTPFLSMQNEVRSMAQVVTSISTFTNKTMEPITSNPPSGPKLTYLMQQAMQPIACDTEKEMAIPRGSVVSKAELPPQNVSGSNSTASSHATTTRGITENLDTLVSLSKESVLNIPFGGVTANESFGSQKTSPPSQGATPNHDLDSPGSTEPRSLPSDRTNSHSTSDGKCQELLNNVFDLAELDSTTAPCSDNQFSSTCSSVTPTHIHSDLSQPDPVENHLPVTSKGDDAMSLGDEDADETGSMPSTGGQSATMQTLDTTIESVLDKIRTGRGKEVEFNPAARTLKEQQAKQMLSIKKTMNNSPHSGSPTVFSSNSEPTTICSTNPYSTEASSPAHSQMSISPRGSTTLPLSPNIRQSTSPSIPGPPSSVYHQRQRVRNALDEASATAYHMQHRRKYPPGQMHYTQPGQNYPNLPPQQHMISGPHSASYIHQQQHYNFSPHPANRIPLRHTGPPHPMYIHPSYQRLPMQQQPQNYYPNYPQQPGNYIHMPQNRPPGPGVGPHSPGGKPYYSPPSLPGQQPMGSGPGYMQQHSPHLQSPSPTTVPLSPCAMMPPPVSQSYSEQKMPSTMQQISPSAPGMYPIYSRDSAGYPVSQLPLTTSMEHLSVPNRHASPSTYTNEFAQSLPQSFLSNPSHFSQTFQQCNSPSQSASAMSMMPPPLKNNIPQPGTPGRKRASEKVKEGGAPISKKKRQQESNIPVQQQLINNISVQNAWKELITRLQTSNYSALLQDPLVTPPLSLHPPKGGVFLGNIVRGSELDSASSFALDKLKKYDLAPYHLRHVKPTNTDEVEGRTNDAYLIENICNGITPSIVPVGPLLAAGNSVGDVETPDNPVCSTPTPAQADSEHKLTSSMLNMFSQHDLNGSSLQRAPTPPVQLLYPFLFQPKASNELRSLHASGDCTTLKVETTDLNAQEASLSSPVTVVKTGEGEKYHLTFTVNASLADNVPTVVRGFTNMLGIDFKSVDYEVSPSAKMGLVVGPGGDTVSVDPGTVPSMVNGLPNLDDVASRIDHYPEVEVTLPSLTASKKQVFCRHCEMSMAEWQGIKRTTVAPGTSESQSRETLDAVFCSLSCLTHYSKKTDMQEREFGAPKRKADNHTWEYSQILYMGEGTSEVQVLLKGPAPKHSKLSLRRQLSMERQINNACQKMLSCKSSIQRWRDVRWRRYRASDMKPVHFYQDVTDDQVNDLLLQYSPALSRKTHFLDARTCRLCKNTGDRSEDTLGRMIQIGIDDWLHINCALWCYDVYENVSGALVDTNSTSYPRAERTQCVHCQGFGAGLPCYRSRCVCIYHVPCAKEAGCMFFTDRGMYCPMHKLTKEHPLYMPDLSAKRRIFIDRDEIGLTGNALLGNSYSSFGKQVVARSGSLLIHSIGHLSFHQMASGHFNTSHSIYPVGYRATRIHWSANMVNKRCRYNCVIELRNKIPLFVVMFSEPGFPNERHEGKSSDIAWKPIFSRVAQLRQTASLIRFYPEHIRGDEMFGLSENFVLRILESVSGIEALYNYVPRFGKIPNLSLPRQIRIGATNTSGCARLEASCPEERYKLQLARFTCSRLAAPIQITELQSNAMGRQCVLSTSTNADSKYNRAFQFRKLTAEQEWRLNVHLAASKRQGGLGLFASRELEKHVMIVELSGELVRDLVARRREQRYRKAQRRDVLFIRVSSDWVLDASSAGNEARHIRHSCDPNCLAEIVVLDRHCYVVISALRKLEMGEELTLNRKVDTVSARVWDSTSDDERVAESRIPCHCNHSSCRKWLN